MAKRLPKTPTDAELVILHVLWSRDQATVRQVLNELSQVREVGYTTVLKQMQIMAEKGLVTRDETVRPQVYRAAYTLSHTQQQVMDDVLERVFKGSPGRLVVQALSSKAATAAELREIRELLDRLEAEAGGGEGDER